MKFRSALRQHGQSMTEFVVAAAFVMVPLFLIVPTAGKYIDMKLATVQAARYSSWEYTANYVDLRDQPGGFEALPKSRLPRKSQTRVAAEARRRFFSDTALPLDSNLDLAGYDVTEANPLWRFHNGLAMYDETNDVALSGSDQSPGRVVSALFGTISTFVGSFGSLLQALGFNVGFDAVNPDGDFTIDGMFTSTVVVAVNEAPNYTALDSSRTGPLFGQPLNLEMKARSGILTENWGAGGKAHTLRQAGGLMPSVLIGQNPVIPRLQNLLSWVSPELSPSSLKFGYPVEDPDVMDEVPPGALEGDSDKADCPGGYCEN